MSVSVLAQRSPGLDSQAKRLRCRLMPPLTRWGHQRVSGVVPLRDALHETHGAIERSNLADLLLAPVTAIESLWATCQPQGRSYPRSIPEPL